MKKFAFCILLATSLLVSNFIKAQGVTITGEHIFYTHAEAEEIVLAGCWNDWAGSAIGQFDLTQNHMKKTEDGTWSYDISALESGHYEYKFIVNGEWEEGSNRTLFIFSPPEITGEKFLLSEVRYHNPEARSVSLAGEWNDWAGSAVGYFSPQNFRMTQNNDGYWTYSIKDIPAGHYQYKFIIDGNWEGGSNRTLHINEQGYIYDPAEYISWAEYLSPNRIRCIFPRPFKPDNLADNIEIDPAVGIESIEMISQQKISDKTGYYVDKKAVHFHFNAHLYNIFIDQSHEKVYVAGDFNNWTNAFNETWQLKDVNQDGHFWLSVPLEIFSESGVTDHFRFVIDGHRWLSPPSISPNRVRDQKGDFYYALYPVSNGSYILDLSTDETIDLSHERSVILTSEGVSRHITPSDELFQNYFISDKALGVILEDNTTTFRVFAPRASQVQLNLYQKHGQDTPDRTKIMDKDPDGVWEITVSENLEFHYYKYQVDGPEGPGEQFDFNRLLSDPYAVANVHHDGKSLILPQDYTDDTFTGWTNQNHQTPALEDLVIYEVNLRDMTADNSIDISEENRRKYLGVIETLQTPYGLTHLKELGINAIEFLPVHEFDDYPYGSYHWGYMTTLFFAPESSYASDPVTGKQVTEFKKLVDTLQNEGFAVLLDVVYNHTGSPNYYAGFDNKYYYRLTREFGYTNYSGCGNDFKTENPMVRRLIVDSVKYWMTEYNIDGFRFDLAELIDSRTLREIYREAKAINPDVILILEPWSFRGNIKGYFQELDFAYWNDDFRNGVKEALQGHPSRENMKQYIRGSVDLWAANPMQSVNYLSSHDDFTLIDELVERSDNNGFYATPRDEKKVRLGGFVTFTSLGIPMISQGQEFLYSKGGIHGGYDAGDAVNSIKWNQRAEYHDVYEYYRDLIHFRQSDEGKPFRLPYYPPEQYFIWLEPRDYPNALGYIINPNKDYGDYTYMVLMNFHHSQAAQFEIQGLSGTWNILADEEGFHLQSPQTVDFSPDKSTTISVPHISGYLLQKVENIH